MDDIKKQIKELERKREELEKQQEEVKKQQEELKKLKIRLKEEEKQRKEELALLKSHAKTKRIARYEIWYDHRGGNEIPYYQISVKKGTQYRIIISDAKKDEMIKKLNILIDDLLDLAEELQEEKNE